MAQRYTYSLTFNEKNPAGVWHIHDMGDKGYCSFQDPVVFETPHVEDDPLYPPTALRVEYERLLTESGYCPEPSINLVEMIQDKDGDCAFDQPCKFGHRVDGHAVYCHNSAWLYSPTKCHRTWYTGGKVRDEDCEGFSPRLPT